MVLVHDTSSRRGLQVYQVSLKNLKRFSSYRADTICDGQTDGRTDRRTGKNNMSPPDICLPTLSGGDINKDIQIMLTCQLIQNMDCGSTVCFGPKIRKIAYSYTTQLCFRKVGYTEGGIHYTNRLASGKHVRAIYTPLNPTFIKKN